MHIHILGICGTFMGGIAALAKAAGHEVTGSDRGAYPPMSELLAELGIEVQDSEDPDQFREPPDEVVIGNALSRGHPMVEYVLDAGLPYTSGPEWLARNVLAERWVLAVAGTHGKTTTASMLAWILDRVGLEPGYLIGGAPLGLEGSARLGEAPYFVVEADEYDTAFFDKRSKFVHYHPRTLILNNLEFDHADIFDDLGAIQTQFHHLMRTVPGKGLVVVNDADPHLAEVLERGCWTPVEGFAGPGSAEADSQEGWRAILLEPAGSVFEVFHDGRSQGQVEWGQSGLHNVENALGALAAARHAGVRPEEAVEALSEFPGVRRRLELRGQPGGISVLDDFAHHPTAIARTLDAARVGMTDGARLFALLEPRSNTMKRGVHQDSLAGSLASADRVLLFRPEDLDWDIETVARSLDDASVHDTVPSMVRTVVEEASQGDVVLVMSNGAFGGIHTELLAALAAAAEQ